MQDKTIVSETEISSQCKYSQLLNEPKAANKAVSKSFSRPSSSFILSNFIYENHCFGMFFLVSVWVSRLKSIQKSSTGKERAKTPAKPKAIGM